MWRNNDETIAENHLQDIVVKSFIHEKPAASCHGVAFSFLL
jgi:hypothetical protein